MKSRGLQYTVMRRGRLKTTALSRAEQALAFNARWQPLLDSGIRLGGVGWVLMSFVSCLLLNDYYRVIGQPGVPLNLAGTWAFLALLGGVLVLSLAVLGTMFMGGASLMVTLHDGRPASLVTKTGFFMGAASAVCILFFVIIYDQRILLAFGVAVPAGAASGFAVLLIGASLIGGAPYLHDRLLMAVGFLSLWAIFAVLMSPLLTINLYSVLRMQFDDAQSFTIALVASLVQMAVCSFVPKRWVLGGTLMAAGWTTMFVSPGPRVIVLIALHVTNLGGGVPAGALTEAAAARICNLGTAERAVLYVDAEGCSKRAALAHLQQLAQAPDDFKRGEIIAGWRRSVTTARSAGVRQ